MHLLVSFISNTFLTLVSKREKNLNRKICLSVKYADTNMQIRKAVCIQYKTLKLKKQMTDKNEIGLWQKRPEDSIGPYFQI